MIFTRRVGRRVSFRHAQAYKALRAPLGLSLMAIEATSLPPCGGWLDGRASLVVSLFDGYGLAPCLCCSAHCSPRSPSTHESSMLPSAQPRPVFLKQQSPVKVSYARLFKLYKHSPLIAYTAGLIEWVWERIAHGTAILFLLAQGICMQYYRNET